MATTNQNIFREAHRLLATKSGREMSDDERGLVTTASIPLNLLPEFSDMTIAEGLDALAKLVEEARRG